MQRIASDSKTLKEHYEVIVVGSGYGGGIAASRLSRLGREVCVLERGREIIAGEYPDTQIGLLKEVQADTPLERVGSEQALFDVRYNHDMNVVVGCGLGGTSLINAGICLRPDPRVLADAVWPGALRADNLEPYFERAEHMLSAACYPMHLPPPAKFAALQAAAHALDLPIQPAKIAVTFADGPNSAGVPQHACIGCGDCVTGCNYAAKNTVLMNYLPDACRHGAQIFTHVKVLCIEAKDEGWALQCRAYEAQAGTISTRLFSLTADLVVLAAGALGSTEIMLRSAAHGLPTSASLGRRFSGNGDMIGFAYNNDRTINGVGYGKPAPQGRAASGPCSNGVIYFKDAADVNRECALEDGVLPSALATFLPALLDAGAKLTGVDTDAGMADKWREIGRELQSVALGAHQGAVHNTLFMVAASHDDSGGTLSLEDDRLRVHWPDAGRQAQIERVNGRMSLITGALGGTYIKNPVWNALTSQSLITGHPLGGCVMANDASAGVVNHKGQVFNGEQGESIYKSLYILDGSIVPRSLGANPLLTICALAERNCEIMGRERGWSAAG